ncbi:MAG: 16S rRNA (adenine(1518)-N(6)/adenine(1519)-N(6))-dimethyltransferase RsmA [Candidatus Bathyarchaeia archaeon]
MNRWRRAKRLGQNFLVDASIRDRIIELASLSGSDTVLEIGAGKGALTTELAKRAGEVLAVEKDPKLLRMLEAILRPFDNVRIIPGDFLKVEIPRFNKVVSCPPYSISSKLIFRLLQLGFERAILVFQKEFAERLVARSGTDQYGRLTVNLGRRAEVRILGYVPRRAFRPIPKVDSAIVEMRMRPSVRELDEGLFQDLTRYLFSQRRRLARGVLKGYLSSMGLDPALAHSIAPDKRVFELEVGELEDICSRLKELIGGMGHGA